jgi:hypothetical protein
MCSPYCVLFSAVSSVNTPIYPRVDKTRNTKTSVFKEHGVEKSRCEREAPNSTEDKEEKTSICFVGRFAAPCAFSTSALRKVKNK